MPADIKAEIVEEEEVEAIDLIAKDIIGKKGIWYPTMRVVKISPLDVRQVAVTSYSLWKIIQCLDMQ